MPAPFEILRKTPKTNCGTCGYATCLAFSAAVAKGGENPAACPYLDVAALSLSKTGEKEELSALGRKRDLALIAHLKEKIAPLDFRAIAPGLGIDCMPSQPDLLEFVYLGQRVLLSKKAVLINQEEPEDPRDQILLYNYVHSGGGDAPAGNWTGLESLPNSISKVRTLATYCEERLATLFSGNGITAIAHAMREVQAVPVPEAPASFGFVIPVLPRVAQYVLFWEADEEEGFPARVKVLFDRQVLEYLDLESLIFSAERLADRLGAIIG